MAKNKSRYFGLQGGHQKTFCFRFFPGFAVYNSILRVGGKFTYHTLHGISKYYFLNLCQLLRRMESRKSLKFILLVGNKNK